MTTVTALAARPRRARAFPMLVRTELRLSLRYPVGLVFGIGLPLLLLVVFGSFPSFTQPSSKFGGVSFFTDYAPTLLVLVLLVLALLSLPIQMAGYRQQGVLRRMSTTPVPALALLGAQLVVNLALGLLSLALLLGVGGGIFSLVLPSQPGWFVLSLVLALAAMFAVGLCVAAFAGSQQIANAIGAACFYPLAFFSGLYVPLAELHSGVLDQLSKALPSGAAFDALQSSLAGRFPGAQAIGVLLGYAVVGGAIAVRWFRWDVERSRPAGGRRGVLARSVTLRGEVTGEQVARVLRDALPARYEVQAATRIKGRFLGTEPAGPDAILVTTGLTGLWRAEVRVVRRAGDTQLQIRPGGDPLYSALGVARAVRRVLARQVPHGQDPLRPEQGGQP